MKSKKSLNLPYGTDSQYIFYLYNCPIYTNICPIYIIEVIFIDPFFIRKSRIQDTFEGTN